MGAASLVTFNRVSKRYRLGLTRTSLPQLVSRGIRGAMGREPRANHNSILWALRDVSFEMKPGESLALVGPNGAGKSTVLKLLSKITMPTEGHIDVGGRLSALLELGAGFHPDLTGRENVYLNGTILGLSRQDITRRLDEIIAFSELEEFIDTPVKRYSSGMHVRLGFSVAACIEPELLLVDEVLAVGDASFRQKCLHRIGQLVERGTSIVFVSHNLYMVQAVCRRGLYLHRGQVRAAGDVGTVLRAYELDVHAERARKLDQAGAAATTGQSRVDGALDITSVTVESAAGRGDVIDSRHTARISVYYNAYHDLEGINLAIFIRRSDGIACCLARTKLDNVRLTLPRGEGVLSLQIEPLQLVTGRYYAEVEVVDEADTMLIKAEKARSDWFSVTGRTRSYDPSFSAVFEPFATWHGPSHVAPRHDATGAGASRERP